MDIVFHSFIVFIGFIALIIGADLLIRGASGIARSLGVPSLIIGLTIVAYGTSLPEFMASFSAMRKGFSGIAVGNVLGSNICNIALVLGLAAILTPIRVEKDVFSRQLPITVFATLVLMAMFMTGNKVGHVEGGLLTSGIIIYTIWIFKRSRIQSVEPVLDTASIWFRNRWAAAGAIFAGCLGLFFGGDWVVDGSTALARNFHVPERVIGGTLVAIGTSLPELITSIVGILKKETDLGVGNAVGSCIFNLLMVLGFTAVVNPIHGTVAEYRLEFFFCFLTLFILWPMARRKLEIGQIHGLILTGLYVAFVLLSFRG